MSLWWRRTGRLGVAFRACSRRQLRKQRVTCRCWKTGLGWVAVRISPMISPNSPVCLSACLSVRPASPAVHPAASYWLELLTAGWWMDACANSGFEHIFVPWENVLLSNFTFRKSVFFYWITGYIGCLREKNVVVNNYFIVWVVNVYMRCVLPARSNPFLTSLTFPFIFLRIVNWYVLVSSVYDSVETLCEKLKNKERKKAHTQTCLTFFIPQIP